jgi:hypothetical protein
MAYELKNNTTLNSHISFSVDVQGWIIIGKLKGISRPYKVVRISGNMYLDHKHGRLTTTPELSISGHYANTAGTKWNDRLLWWNWGNETITFHSLPNSIKENIYSAIERESREFLLTFHNDYKELTANRGFVDKTAKQMLDEQDDSEVFMSSVGATQQCKWENMDVSEWSIARKELGLPKPPRKPRKKKVV